MLRAIFNRTQFTPLIEHQPLGASHASVAAGFERTIVTQFERAVIVGVGLLGGSIGMALRKRQVAKTVVGFSPRGSSLESAIARGAIDHSATSLTEACDGADLAIICTPRSKHCRFRTAMPRSHARSRARH